MNAVRKDIFIAAPIARVWEFLTDQKKLAAWLMDNDMQLKEGAGFSFTSEPSGAWDGKIHCEIKDLIERERLSFTWNANDIGAETLVTFELVEMNGGTQLSLTHGNFEDAVAGAEGRHAAGWTSALKALKTSMLDRDAAYDWSTLQITYYLEASLADVFSAWTTAEGLRSFWADEVTHISHTGIRQPEGEKFQIGDRVELTFPTGGSTLLEILNIEDNRFMLFSFGEGYGWVHIGVSEEGNRTKIVLRQIGIFDDEEAKWEIHAHARGWWISNLMNLKSVLLYGNDLRIRHQETANGLSVLYLPGGREADIAHNWTKFNVYLHIDADPDRVLEGWKCAKGLKNFFIADMQVTDENHIPREDHELLRSGDLYAWQGVHNYSGEGKILKSDTTEFSFTFGTSYIVNVTVEPQSKGTLLNLEQSDMTDTPEERVNGTLNCRSCWIYFMINLKSYLEHGVDLRDMSPDTADSISVGYNL